MIKVFGQTDTSFDSNGDIVLKPLKAKVYCADNGDFYLEIETGLEYVDYLVEGNIIVAPTPQGEQAFRITNPQKTKTKITIKAWHVFYDSKNYLIADSYAENKTCSQALAWLNDATEPNSEFTTGSDITLVDSYRCVRTSLHDAFMTVLERWGGHLVRNNFDVQIKSSIGYDNGITVQYKKNLQDITVEENWDDVVTKILPVGKDGILLNELNPSVSIYITSDTQYSIPYTKTVSFEQDINEEDYPSETAYKTALVNDLRNQANAYLEVNCVPQVNYTLNAHIDRNVNIGDVIAVKDERLDLNLLTDVISYEWDCMTSRYTQIEFGNFRRTLSDLLTNVAAISAKRATTVVDARTAGLDEEIAGKQNELVSGENIKTINGADILGSGDLTIEDLGILDLFYPVGCYFETSNSSFNPNTAWGGTWVRETEGLVHIGSGSTYTNGSTGGEKTHTLQESEIPSHRHTTSTSSNAFIVYNRDDLPSSSQGIGETQVMASSSSGKYAPTSTSSSFNATYAKYVGYTGGGSSHNNMQPYLVVNRWHRTA